MSLYVDVVRYPDLFMNIFRRELHGKYRGSVLGLFWTLINPLALMAVYTLVFSVLLKAFQIEHYPLFVLSGLLTWVFFQSAVQMSCSSLFAQPTLVKQVRTEGMDGAGEKTLQITERRTYAFGRWNWGLAIRC